MCRLSVQDEWSETAHDMAISIYGGPMWFMAFAFGLWHNMKPGRAIWGKWRIPDGKGESGRFSYLEL
jgi:hypothetical protein